MTRERYGDGQERDKNGKTGVILGWWYLICLVSFGFTLPFKKPPLPKGRYTMLKLAERERL
jgi:hypothetical protein